MNNPLQYKNVVHLDRDDNFVRFVQTINRKKNEHEDYVTLCIKAIDNHYKCTVDLEQHFVHFKSKHKAFIIEDFIVVYVETERDPYDTAMEVVQ